MIANQVGQVLELYISEKDKQTRTPMDVISLDIGGVLNDKFFQTDETREVLLASYDSYTLAKENNMEISAGTLGENVLMDYNPYKLEVGQKITIGDAQLEISLYCPICNHLSRVKKGLPKLLKNDRGIFAKVIKAGDIKLGDKVYLV